MQIEMIFTKPHKAVTIYAKDRVEIHEKVHNTLTRNGIEEKKAADCACWAQSAVRGETYNEIDFDVYAVEA